MSLKNPEGALELVCTKCTRAATFPAGSPGDAYRRAAAKGWKVRLDTVDNKIAATICPRCK
jgi:hypothetical protein